MSRGLGKIERFIALQIAEGGQRVTVGGDKGSVHITTWNVIAGCFKMVDWEPTPAHRKAAVRAMRSFVRKHQQYALMGGQGRKQLVLYDAADPVSVVWAEETVRSREFIPMSKAIAIARERGDGRLVAA